MSDTKDTIRVVGECSGHNHVVRRRADGSEENGVLAPHEEGRPLHPGQEYVKLEARQDEPGVYNVVFSHKGPTRANSKNYREGYERTFGPRKLDTSLN